MSNKKSLIITIVCLLVIAASWITFWQVDKHRNDDEVASNTTFDESNIGEILPVQEDVQVPDISVAETPVNAGTTSGNVSVENTQPAEPVAPAIPAINVQAQPAVTAATPQTSSASTTNPAWKDYNNKSAYFSTVIGSSWITQESKVGQGSRVTFADQNKLIALVEVVKAQDSLAKLKESLSLSNATGIRDTSLAGIPAISYRAPGQTNAQYLLVKDGYQYFIESNNEVFLTNLKTL